MTEPEKVRALEAEVEDYAGQLEIARDMIRAAQDAAADMEAQIASARETSAEMQAQLVDARSTAAEMEASIEAARRNHDLQAATIDRLERELGEERSALRTAERRIAEMIDSRAAREAVAADARIAALQEEVREWQHRTVRREAQIARARRSLAQATRAGLGARVAPDA